MMGVPNIVTSADNGKVGFAMKYDYADAAASALIGSNNENKIYELSGNPITYDEFAQVLGNVLGKEISVKHVDDDAYAATLKQLGMADIMIPMLVATKKGTRDGLMEVHSNDLEMLLGRPAISLKNGLTTICNILSKCNNNNNMGDAIQ